MKVCLHSISYAGYFYEGGHIPLKDLIPKAAKMGYEALEIMAKQPLASPLEIGKHEAKELREIAESYNIELSIVAAYADFTKPDILDREKEMLYARECVRIAENLNISLVRFYGGGDKIHEEIPFHRQWELARQGISWISKIADNRGIKIVLEPHTSVLQTHEDVLDMIQQVGSDNLRVCLDPPLLAIHKEPVEKAVRAVGKLLAHAHVMDFVRKPLMVKYNYFPGVALTEYTPIQDVLLGQGEVELETFVRTAKEIGYEGCLSYEVCIPFHIHHTIPTIQDVDKMVYHAAQYLRKLLGKSIAGPSS